MSIEGSIKGVIDNVSAQETAAVANQLAAIADNLDQKDQEQKVDDKSYIQKLLDAKSGRETSKQILSDLFSKMASLGVKLDPDTFAAKAKRTVKDEYDSMFNNRENTTDQVDVKSLGNRIKAAKKLNQNNGEGGGQEKNENPLTDTAKMAGIMDKYSEAFAQFLLSPGTNFKKKIEELEFQMRQEGFTNKDILGLQQNLRQSIRSQLAGQIKESLLKKIFSKEKTFEFVMNEKELNRTLRFALDSKELGGWDFGGYNKSLQGTVNEKIKDVKSDVKDFITEQLREVMIKKNLNGDTKSAENEIKDLIELGTKTGFNVNRFLAGWKATKYHLGFVPVPSNALAQSMLGSGMHNKKEQQNLYEFTSEDEKELLINQLRAVYMQRAMKGTFMSKLETSFKVRKLKNGLVKLGITFDELDKIEKEGVSLARVRILGMLKEAFEERATFFELSGHAFDLVETKIKGLIKNLARLGMELTQDEIEEMRNQADEKMFDTARFELENAIISYEGNRAPSYEKKIKLLVKVMLRLKEEAGIKTDYDPILRFSSVVSAA